MKEYLLIKTSGRVDNIDDHKRLANELYEEIMKHDFSKVLLDHNEIDFTTSITDKTQLITYYSEAFPPDFRLLKIAVVANEKNKEIGDFWDVYANN
jgi:hypothetical protein